MNPLISFLASGTGRVVRVVVGLALMLCGFFGLNGAVGVLVIVVGAVPFFAGIFDVCVFAPLFGAPFSGPAIRAAK